MCGNLEILRVFLLLSLVNRAVLVPDPRKYVIYDHLRVFSSRVTPVVRVMTVLFDHVVVVSGDLIRLSRDSFAKY